MKIYHPSKLVVTPDEHASADKDTQRLAVETTISQPFPLECLGDALFAMAEAVCKTERTPANLAGCCALGILSASIGKGLEIKSGSNRITRGNLYILASAESGSGKSETFRHFAKPFQQFEKKRIEIWEAQTRPGLLAEKTILEAEMTKLKRRAGKQNDAQEREEVRIELQGKMADLATIENQLHSPVLACEDITTEKLAVILTRNNEQIASLSADAVSVVNVLLGRYNPLDRTDEGLYLKAFSGEPCRVDRQSRDSVSLQSPCLSALWLTQPDKLEDLLSKRSLSDGGLLPRILACHSNCEPREIHADSPIIPIEVESAYCALIQNLISSHRLAVEHRTIEPSQAALERLNEHHNQIVKRRRSELRDVTSFAARWTEQGWRIALCLHAAIYCGSAYAHPLALETAEQAIKIADWFANEQLTILSGGRMKRKSERFQKISSLISVDYRGTATLRDLKLRHNIAPEELRALAVEFPGRLEFIKQQTGGRPSEVVRLLIK